MFLSYWILFSLKKKNYHRKVLLTNLIRRNVFNTLQGSLAQQQCTQDFPNTKKE